ncbi:MAG: hypothetical protein M1347_06665 [Chloroflexi bacterium]|nr:hypothetical protein [Chloroflexota bacterium]
MRAVLLSPLSALAGIFTYVHRSPGVSHNGQAIIAQVAHLPGSSLAHCRFLAPDNGLNSRSMPDLLDGLLKQVGSRGAHSLVAEVDEDSPGFSVLRQNGFSIYARQQIWKIDNVPNVAEQTSLWQPTLRRDELAIQLLRNGLVPGQVQQVEAAQEKPDGYVLYNKEQLLAYAEVKRGPRGVWLQPFVSLDADPFDEALADLLKRLRPRKGRPVYVCLRSYQDWLQSSLEKLGAEPGPRQAVMAKRTTLPLKAEETRRIPVANRSAEPTTPIHAPLPKAREPEWIRYDQTPNYR